MKQPKDFQEDGRNGRRFWQGVVIAILASAVIVWSANELFDLMLTAAKGAP